MFIWKQIAFNISKMTTIIFKNRKKKIGRKNVFAPSPHQALINGNPKILNGTTPFVFHLKCNWMANTVVNKKFIYERDIIGNFLTQWQTNNFFNNFIKLIIICICYLDMYSKLFPLCARSAFKFRFMSQTLCDPLTKPKREKSINK